MRRKMLELIKNKVSELCEINNIKFDEDMVLYGENAVLDSIAFVQLIAMIEQELLEMDIDVVLVNDRVFSFKNSPFRDIKSILKYIEGLLNE
tara:strand:- start:9 stop:284 length:276 start_codon:yes stop_codon:yes gene_type:complete